MRNAKSKETVLSDKFPYRRGWIPACAGMTAER
ncbi:flavodoxin family protein, partial [Neisseria gonorrhoeae]